MSLRSGVSGRSSMSRKSGKSGKSHLERRRISSGFEKEACERAISHLKRAGFDIVMGKHSTRDTMDTARTIRIELDANGLPNEFRIKPLLAKYYKECDQRLDNSKQTTYVFNQILNQFSKNKDDKLDENDIKTHCIFAGSMEYMTETDFQGYINANTFELKSFYNDKHFFWVMPDCKQSEKLKETVAVFFEQLSKNDNCMEEETGIENEKKNDDDTDNDECISDNASDAATHYVIFECSAIQSDAIYKGMLLKLLQIEKKICAYALRYLLKKKINNNNEISQDWFNKALKNSIKQCIGLCGIILNLYFENRHYIEFIKDCIQYLPCLQVYLSHIPFCIMDYSCLFDNNEKMLEEIGSSKSLREERDKYYEVYSKWEEFQEQRDSHQSEMDREKTQIYSQQRQIQKQRAETEQYKRENVELREKIITAREKLQNSRESAEVKRIKAQTQISQLKIANSQAQVQNKQLEKEKNQLEKENNQLKETTKEQKEEIKQLKTQINWFIFGAFLFLLAVILYQQFFSK